MTDRPKVSLDSPLLTAEQVAEFLGVNAKTVYRYAREGVIPHRRIGARNVRFIRAEIEDWIAGMLQGYADVERNITDRLGGGRG